MKEQVLFLWAVGTDYQAAFNKLKEQFGKGCEIKIINNSQDFSKLDLGSFKPSAVFILSEINWAETSGDFGGYDIAYTLLQKCKDHNFFQLYFCSVLPAYVILNRCKGFKRYLVQNFQHIDLLNPTVSPYKMNRQRFRYLHDYCLTLSGILDQIAHEIDYYLFYPQAHHLEHMILQLEELGEKISGKSNIEEAKKILNDFENCAIQQTKNQLLVLKGSIMQQSRTLQKDDDIELKIPKNPHKLMIIEDESFIAEHIRKYMLPFFNEVIVFSDAVEAYTELKNNNTAYRALIVDIKMNDKYGLAQPLSGFEILKLCLEDYQHIALRVISGLPRRSLQYLPSEISNKKILAKSSFNENFIEKETFRVFIKRLNKEIKLKEVNLSSNMPGSTLGPFSAESKLKMYYYKQYNEPNNEGFLQMLNCLCEKAIQFVKGELDDKPNADKVATIFPSPKRMNIPEAWHEYLETVLLHRLIVFMTAKLNQKFEILHFTDNEDEGFCNCPGFRKSVSKDIGQYYNLRLGIRTSDRGNGRVCVHIEEKDFLKHELAFFANFDPKTVKVFWSAFPNHYEELIKVFDKFKKDKSYLKNKNIAKILKNFNITSTLKDFDKLVGAVNNEEKTNFEPAFCSFAEEVLNINDRISH